MISEKVWKERFKELCHLTGNINISLAQGDAFYARLKNFDERDFLRACKDDGLIADLVKERLNMPCIKRYIEKYQFIRLERELEKQKDADKLTLQALYKNDGMPLECRDALDRLFGKYSQANGEAENDTKSM